MMNMAEESNLSIKIIIQCPSEMEGIFLSLLGDLIDRIIDIIATLILHCIQITLDSDYL